MGSLPLTVRAGVLAAGLAVAAPPAHAAGGGVSVSPSTPAPGSDLALRVTGCPGATGTAASAAFVADALLTGAEGTLTGETRVRSTLTPGTYEVRVDCASERTPRTLRAALTVAGADAPSAPASPVAPVTAGGGGAARLASVDAAETGPNTAQTVTGLVLAGVAAVAVVLTGARRSRRTD